MVFKGAATMVVRLSRALISHPFKPLFPARTHELPQINKTYHYKYPPRSYLFPSIYRSFLTYHGSSIGQQHQRVFANLMPFRAALNEIKRRLFFAAPSGTRLVLSLLGYSLVQQSPFDPIRLDETFNQIGGLLSKNTIVDSSNDDDLEFSRASLDDYELGRLLGYGCNAAVYEARLRRVSTEHQTIPNYVIPSSRRHNSDETTESDIEILSRQSSNASSVYEDASDTLNDDDSEQQRLNELTLKEVRYRASVNMNRCSSSESVVLPPGQFNLAIKMLFNYGVQSNAAALLKAMDKELLPLHQCPHHPNVVRMYSCFVDSFPLLDDAHECYPMALPARLSPEGFGRNKTLFIVMRRYDLTVTDYIRIYDPNNHERLILFAQLLEALFYLKQHSIVHRDLKSDNVLVSSETGELVLADFGCALHQPPNLKLPYFTDEIGKGGNLALMAPEILTCQAGPQTWLDYNKADLWASGALCYEFFSEPNPFFHGSLRQETYDDKQLPSLPSTVPPLIERLVHSMLHKTPRQRPSISIVSDCIHLYLWFTSTALNMDKNELYQAYMWTALETLFTKRTLARVELSLKKLFFERQSYRSLTDAQNFLNRLASSA